MRQGFTLVQVSIVLIVASLVLVNLLPGNRTTLSANNTTTVKLNTVLTAMRQYESANAALPCPADASKATGNSSYGAPSANPGATTNCTGGAPAANYVDATNHVAIGSVPVRALGLSNDYAVDSYGREITYAVDTNATTCFSGSLPGQITVTDNGTASTTIAALVSHGSDGHGAWIPLTGTSGTAVRLNSGSTDADQLTNAHVNSSFVATTTLTNFVNKLGTNTFDDIVVYKNPLWTLNASPAAAAAMIPSITPPTNGSYFTAQIFTFTITYGGSVTVTGSPELTLSIPQSNGTTATHYATYTGSTGNTLTFTYTVVSSDYAPSGISMSSPILLNGGTIKVNGNAACLAFTPPSLTAVLLNPIIIYVADEGNSRVQKFSTSGTWLGSLGGTSSACSACMCTSGTCPNSSGSGNGQFSQPTGVAVDASGNVWVTDWNNSNVQKFDSNGNYLLTYTGAASPWGSIPAPYAVSFDNSGNVWVVSDFAPGVQEFSSTGTYISEFGTRGGSPGQFNGPAGISFDPWNNFFVADGTRVEKFTPPSTFDLQFGTAATAPLPFAKAETVIATAAGNVWVADVQNSYYHLLKFDTNGNYLMGAAPAGQGAGQLQTEQAGIAIDPSGNLWVNDYYQNTVEEFDSCGRYLFRFGSSGTGNGQFNGPGGIALYPNTKGPDGACITGTGPPANGAYTTGQPLTFTVTYSAAVTVAGTPRLVFTIGANTRYANYVSGSGTTTLTFTYTVQSSDTTAGISTTNAIDLNGGSISSGGVNANLNYTPSSLGGITVNSSPFMLVADSGNNKVQKLDLSGNYLLQFGTPGSGNGQFNAPKQAAMDGSGNVWVTDYGNNRVQEFSNTGTWLASLGGTASACTNCLCTGPSACPTNSGSGKGQFNGPMGITIDGSGNIWVVDYNNLRAEEFDKNGNFLLEQDQVGNEANMDYLAFDSSGNLDVTESGNDNYAVLKFSTPPVFQILQTIGFTPYNGNYQIPNYPNYNVPTPNGLGFDACRNIWFADISNNTVLAVDYGGNYLTSFTDAGGVQGIALDNSGKIYVGNQTSNTVTVYNSAGVLQSTFSGGVGGGSTFSGPVGLTLVGSAPTTLPITSCPAVILADAGPSNGNYTTGQTLGFAVTYDQPVTVTGTPQIGVRIGTNTRYANYVSGSGTATLTFQYTVVAGDNAQSGQFYMTLNSNSSTSTVGLNGGTITSNSINAHLNFVVSTDYSGVTVNKVTPSDIYIADTSNHAVRKVTASTGFISTVAGTGSSGSTHENDGSLATVAKLAGPAAVTFDGAGNMYIADSTNHVVLKVTSGTNIMSYFAGTGATGSTHENDGSLATVAKLAGPSGVAVDGGNNVYIADTTNHVVLKVASGTNIISYFAGTGATGTTHENDGSLATVALLAGPSAVATDSSNNVYIADGTNHVVLKVTAATGKIAYFAGTGATGSTHENDGSLATAAKLKTPSGVVVDGSGNAYIADSGNDVILKVTAADGKIAIITGTVGSAGENGDRGLATTATVNAAKGVAVDASGNVYIADTSDNRARWILGSYGSIFLLAGNGTGAFAGDGAAATSGELNAPAGIAVSR